MCIFLTNNNSRCAFLSCILTCRLVALRLDTKAYYIPHTRTRGYLVATRLAPRIDEFCNHIKAKEKAKKAKAKGKGTGKTEKEAPKTILSDWGAKVKELKYEKGASDTLEAFLFPVT